MNRSAVKLALCRGVCAAVLLMTADTSAEMINGIDYSFFTSQGIATVVGPADLSGDVIIPATVQSGGMTYRVTSISAGAFSNNDGLTSISMPSVTEIGEKAFLLCGQL